MILICPTCGITDDDDDPGDLKMCADCGSWSRLENGKLRRLTKDEQSRVAAAFGEFLKSKRP
jgi:hypothetical protein